MKPIRIVAIGPVHRPLLDPVAAALWREFHVPCSIAPIGLDPSGALHPERQQYHSTKLVEDLLAMGRPEGVLGITAVDLYIPILTFVFGEAQLDGDCAVISYCRLRQEFYGLSPDDGLLRERLAKEAVHEIGHTFGLTHCEDQNCVMASAHSVEWLDLRGGSLCVECRERMN
jgi:archaemetzincin